MKATTLLGIALATLGGCAQDETALLVSICSDISYSEFETLQLDVTDPDLRTVTETYDGVVLPIQISLRPGAVYSGAIVVRASLLMAGAPIVTRRVTTRFVDGEDRDVRIFLEDRCVGSEHFCEGAGETCESGQCVQLGPGTDACEGGGGDGDADADGECDRDGDQSLGLDCGGNDCDDDDPATYPGNREVCDQRDNDCSGEADDGLWSFVGGRYASFATTEETAPTIAYGAGHYGTAWRAGKSCSIDEDCEGAQTCSNGSCGVQEVRFVRQAPDTSIPEITAQQVVSSVSSRAGEPMLAWSGSEWGMLFEDEADGDSAIYYRGVASDGFPIGAARLVSSGTDDAFTPALAPTGDGWGAIWSEGVRLAFAHLDPDGAVLADAVVTDDPSGAFSGSIDWGEDRFGVAWIDGAGAGSVEFAILSVDGAELEPPATISLGSQTIGDAVDLTWSGDGFAIVWDEVADGINQIYFGRIDRDGVVVGDPQQLSSASRAVAADIVYTGSELAVVWAEGPEGDSNVMLQRLTTDGTPTGDPVAAIGDDIGRGARPVIAWNPDDTEYGIVWQDERLAPDVDIWFNRYVCQD